MPDEETIIIDGHEMLDALMLSVSAMVKAYLELNTIRARDGVPRKRDGTKSDVTEEYFSEVVDELDNAVKHVTGKSAHCHPMLYANAEKPK